MGSCPDRRSFLKSVPGLAAGIPALFSVSFPATSPDRSRFDICSGDKTALVVYHRHEVAARRLSGHLEELTGRKFELQAEPDSTQRPLIVLGTIRDSLFGRLAGESRLRKLGPEGILLLTTNDLSRPVLLVGGGGAEAVHYAIGELINYRTRVAASTASVDSLDLVDNPHLPYRFFWNWDHSTNWVPAPGEQYVGCFNPYLKTRDAFLDDFKAVTDYMSERKLNGLILWGFLRDAHGGVEASRELVGYARARGVRLLPGVGTSEYGGFYYAGKHPYNMTTWLSDKPEQFRFLKEEGETRERKDALCPSQPENREWLGKGGQWLFSEFKQLGGVNLENGDFYACQCNRCRQERVKHNADPNFYWDMQVTQLPVIEAAKRVSPDAWLTYATYTGFSPEQVWLHTDSSLIRGRRWPQFVEAYPDYTICQWTYSSMVDGWGVAPESEVRRKWPSGLRPPTKISIGLVHQGSQWWRGLNWWSQTPSGKLAGGRYDEIVELIRYTCQRCAEEGLQGIEIQGEVSPRSPMNELNYLALEEFTWHPRRTMDEFIDERLSPVYGSKERSRLFLQLLRSPEKTPAGLSRLMSQALEMSRDSALDARQKRRWENLAGEFARRITLVLTS